MSQARTRHKKEQLKVSVPSALPPPRNPVAVAGRQRRAGSHAKSGKAVRQQERQALQKQLARGGDRES